MSDILIILVGKSGAGKSTFCRLMGDGEHWFVSSALIKERVRKTGEEVNHDTIHWMANRLYSENPRWQVQEILKRVHDKGYLILDGPRRVKEVGALAQAEGVATLIVRIRAEDEHRFERLQERDGVDRDVFKRIVEDERDETELDEILDMSCLTISNGGSIEDLSRKAEQFKKFLQGA